MGTIRQSTSNHSNSKQHNRAKHRSKPSIYKTNTSGVAGYISGSIMGLSLTDISLPLILGVTPVNETTVGRRTAITVRAEDRTGLRSITLEYLNANNEWNHLETRNVSGTAATTSFNLNALANGLDRDVTIRAFATNLGNLRSETEVIRTYDFRVEDPAPVQNLTMTKLSGTCLMSAMSKTGEEAFYKFFELYFDFLASKKK